MAGDLEFMYKDKLAHLAQSYIYPSLWFIAEGPRLSTPWIPPFDHALRSDEWTAQLHNHHILGYVGFYVDDLLIAGHDPSSSTRLEDELARTSRTGCRLCPSATISRNES